MKEIKLYTLGGVFLLISLKLIGQNRPEIGFTSGTTLFTNGTRYSNNLNNGIFVNFPIKNKILIQPQIINSSIKGEDKDGYFTNSAFITQLNIGYIINLPKIYGIEHKLTPRLGLGLIKSDVLRYNNNVKKFNEFSYPFYSKFVGLDYSLNINKNYAINLRFDYYITETEWLDGNPTSKYDNIIIPSIGVAYVFCNNSDDNIKSNKKNTTDSLIVELQKSFNNFKRNVDDRINKLEAELNAKNIDNIKDTLNSTNIYNLNKEQFSISKTLDTNNIKLPSSQYSVVCGAYFTAESAFKFSKVLVENGIENKIVYKDLSKKMYFITIFESNNYREAVRKLEDNYTQLKALGVKGRLWIWNKNQAKNISDINKEQ